MEARKQQVRMVSAKEKEMVALRLKSLDREEKEGYLVTPLANRIQIVAEENGAASFTRGGSFVCSEIKLCNQSVELTRFASAHRAAHL